MPANLDSKGIRCKIKNCIFIQGNTANFCFKCEKFPCDTLKHLDKRYRTKYTMSMIENLENIKEHGIRKFVKNETVRWSCSECSGTICVHNRKCYTCNAIIR